MDVVGDDLRLMALLRGYMAHWCAPSLRILRVDASHLDPGLSGATVRRYRVTVRGTTDDATEIRLVVKGASLTERRVVAHLNAQDQSNVPRGHTLDLVTDAPAMLCLRDGGDTTRPTSLEAIAPMYLRHEAAGLAAIHVANRADAAIVELLDEFARNWAATIAAVEAADDALLARPIRSAGGVTGPLGGVLYWVAIDHVLGHVRDIIGGAPLG